MWLNYQQLLYFREIARLGGISKAAEKLTISSPALSMQLKNLEELLGSPLFLRKRRKLILTDFGKYVLSYAEKIFSTGEELLSNINNNLVNNQIKIGVSAGLPKGITLDLIDYMTENFPETSLLIIEGHDQSLLKELLGFELDAIFTNKEVYHNESAITSQLFLQSKVSIYGLKKFKNLKKGFPDSLHGQPIIMPSLHSDLRIQIDEWYIKNHINYKLVVELQDSASKKMSALKGHGVVALSSYGAQELIKDKKIELIGDIDTTEDYFITTRIKKVTNSNILDNILNNLSKVFNED